MAKLKELRENANKLLHDMKVLNDKFGKEKKWSDEDKAKYEAMEKDFDGFKEAIKRAEKLEQEERFFDEVPEQNNIPRMPTSNKDEDQKRYDEYFWKYMRGEHVNLMLLQRDMSVGDNAKGGYTVPTAFYGKVIEALKERVLLRKLGSHILTTSTTEIPVEDAAPTFGWISENGAYPITDTSFKQILVKAYKAGGVVKLSEELLNDSAINIEQYVMSRMIQGLEVLEENAFINGDGSSKPKGITTAEVGVTTAKGITAEDVIDMFYSIKSGYREKAVWVVSDDFEKAIRKLKDAQGQYIWQNDFKADTPSMILGRPVYTSSFMPAVAVNAAPAIFGDMSYYQIADRGSMAIQRLNELYSGNGQIGFRVNRRVDGNIIVSDAIKALKVGGSAG